MEWILGVLVVMQVVTAVVLVLILKRNLERDVVQEPSKYIALVDKKYNDYLTDIVQKLNHEYGVPLMKEEVADSRLVDYIVNSFVNDIPVEKCAGAIVYLMDELVEQAEESE